MAIKAGALIVPVSVSGARKVMPKRHFAIHPGTVRITLQDPISAADYSLEQRQELINVTREAILKGLDPEERPLPEAEKVAERTQENEQHCLAREQSRRP
jgi:1-acyl-sn-glycerol-3-phosphate acyltransferase